MSRHGLFALFMSCLPVAAVSVAGLGGAAHAQTALPDLYTVSGVAANDVLNVRAAPDAKSSVLGELAPGMRDVEVVEIDASRKWARVNLRERAGWVSMQFLTAQDSAWVQGALPQTLACHGTEPFWSLRNTSTGLTLSAPGKDDRNLETRKVMDRGFEGDRTRAIIAGDATGRVTAVVQPGLCTDGMSDRSFGLTAILVMDGAGAASSMYSGCCSIAAR